MDASAWVPMVGVSGLGGARGGTWPVFLSQTEKRAILRRFKALNEVEQGCPIAQKIGYVEHSEGLR
jgi:hypothetical protein